MATCDINALLESGKDFIHLPENEREACKIQIAAQILLALDPTADVTPATLLDSGKDFAHLSSSQQKTAELQLLCEIYSLL